MKMMFHIRYIGRKEVKAPPPPPHLNTPMSRVKHNPFNSHVDHIFTYVFNFLKKSFFSEMRKIQI